MCLNATCVRPRLRGFGSVSRFHGGLFANGVGSGVRQGTSADIPNVGLKMMSDCKLMLMVLQKLIKGREYERLELKII